ncbi:hypothetical protein [Streptacidiphilus sp. MAP5-3]|uniref:hypothetical protein n=1 Tax=unclassified Streptacidiphilus TaxID=2643834 RepID=UPI003513C6F9
MRRRSVLLVVSGVLAVGGIVLPSIGQKQTSGDTRIVSVEVNGGKPVVLGPTDRTSFTFAVTAKDKSGIKSVDKIGIWGGNYGVLRPSSTTCVAKSKEVSVCTGTVSVDITKQQLFDDMAGQWHVEATANANDGDHFESDTAGDFFIRKSASAVITGVPPTATTGQPIDIEGQLQQPDWQTQLWVPNTGQPVLLCFKPQGGSTWQTVKTTTTDSQGYMSASVKVTGTGTYAWVYQGKYWSEPVTTSPVQVTVS